MSTSSQNSVVIADKCCEAIYSLCNKIASCADFLHVKTSVIDSEVTLRLIDKFNRVYYIETETDSNGYAIIDMETFPKALLNEYAGKFRITVFQNAELVQFVANDGSKYDSVSFECANSTPTPTSTYIDISL